MYAGTIGTPASIARIAAPFLKVPILPVRDSVPSGKITTDQRCARCCFSRSRAGRAPPARGIGKVLINSSVSIASHLRLKIESAAATTKARNRKRLGRACSITTASRALLWLETKTTPPLRDLTRYRSMIVSGEKAPISGKIKKVCMTARTRRMDRFWVQEGAVTGGGLVVSNSLPPVAGPVKVGARVPCRTIASVATGRPLGKVNGGPLQRADGSPASGDRKRVCRDQPQPGSRAGPGDRGRGPGQCALDGPGGQEHRRRRRGRRYAAGAQSGREGGGGRHRRGREGRSADALHRRADRHRRASASRCGGRSDRRHDAAVEGPAKRDLCRRHGRRAWVAL